MITNPTIKNEFLISISKQSEMEKLVELSDLEIRIDFILHAKCRTTIRLKSLIHHAPLAFKVQTSSPHKFLVNPPSGLVPPLSSAVFQIVLKPQSCLPAAFPRSPSDRFLLKTAAAPDLASDSPESSRSELVNRWFNSAPHRRTYDVKLKVYFVGPFLLAQSAGAGDSEAVRNIIKRHRSVVSELSAREAESLHRAAAQFPEIVSLLMESGFWVDEFGRMTVAAGNDDRRMEENECGPSAGPTISDVDRCSSDVGAGRDKGHINEVVSLERGQAVLHAARRGELDTLRFLLEEGADTNSTDHYGLTPLHVAAIKSNEGAAAMLVGFGADVDCRDTSGHTPLHLAVQGGSTGTVVILLTGGANVNAVTKMGATPLYVARLMEHEDIARLLVENGGA